MLIVTILGYTIILIATLSLTHAISLRCRNILIRQIDDSRLSISFPTLTSWQYKISKWLNVICRVCRYILLLPYFPTEYRVVITFPDMKIYPNKICTILHELSALIENSINKSFHGFLLPVNTIGMMTGVTVYPTNPDELTTHNRPQSSMMTLTINSSDFDHESLERGFVVNTVIEAMKVLVDVKYGLNYKIDTMEAVIKRNNIPVVNIIMKEGITTLNWNAIVLSGD